MGFSRLSKTFLVSIFLLVSCTHGLAKDEDEENITLENATIDSMLLQLSSQIEDTNKVNLLNKLISEYLVVDIDKALEYSQQALNLSKKLNFLKGEANTLNNFGTAYTHLAEYKKAMEKIKEAEVIYRDIKFRKGIASTLNNIGMIYLNKGNYDKAIEYYIPSLDIEYELGNEEGVAASCNNIGIVYYYKGDYERAVEFYLKGLQIREKLGQKRYMAQIYNNIGGVYYQQGDFKTTEEYFLKSMVIKKKIGDKAGIASSYANLGVLYKIQGEYAKAVDFQLKALTLHEELQSRDGVANASESLALLYLAWGNFEKSLGYFNDALSIYSELDNQHSISNIQNSLGDFYLQTKQYSRGIESLTNSIEISIEVGERNLTKDSYELISKLLFESGEYKQAYLYHLKYTVLKDTLFNDDRSKEIGKLEAKYDMEKEQEEAKRIEAAKIRMDYERETRRNNLQFSAILIFIVAVFASITVLGRFKLPVRVIEGVIFFAFLLFFEFLLVLSDPYIEVYSKGAPLLKLGFNAVVAALVFPLHSYFEQTLKNRIFKT